MNNLGSGADETGDEDETGHEPLPVAISLNERRLQVRAYNFWTRLLGDRDLPAIADLDLAALPDFAAYGVLIDFSTGLDDAAIGYMGEALAAECGSSVAIRKVSDVPGRSLLSRITDHYMQIVANQAPIGFEAEFVNMRGVAVLYRGILLPFSGDGTKITHILGVINWKELAEPDVTDAIQSQIGRQSEPSAPLNGTHST
jgi:hypothetical protein